MNEHYLSMRLCLTCLMASIDAKGVHVWPIEKESILKIKHR